MTAVDVFNPVPPEWYVQIHDIGIATDLVRNGNAVFWKIERTHPDRVAPGFPIEGPPVEVPDYGLFLPGSGETPPGAIFFGPPPGRAGLTLPGIPQHSPMDRGYPVVKSGSVSFDGNAFKLS